METKKPSIPQIKDISVGQSMCAENASWVFKGKVAKNFTDHVKHSVPMYNEGHDLICKLSDYFLHDDSFCYDLGASTGVLLNKLAKHNQNKQIRYVGIDVEQDMVAQANSEFPLDQ